MSLKIDIEDLYGLHKGFSIELEPGFTALVGPNGSGKTTLLHQIKEYALKNGIDVWEYSNLVDGGNTAMQNYLESNDMKRLAKAAMLSEGENVALNFSYCVNELGQSARTAHEEDKTLVVILDALDSGASIDSARSLRSLFDLIYEHDIANGADIYIVMAVNHYELAKTPSDCVNVRTGEHMHFVSYEKYAEFICSFEERYPRTTANK